MTQLNESPIITVERRKAITIIVASVILSLALGGGLMKVGSGFASRSSDGITVTGSAKTTATADSRISVACFNANELNGRETGAILACAFSPGK